MKVDKSKWENTLIKDSIKTLKVKDAVQKKDYLLTGKYPIISQEKDFISGYCNTEDNLNKDLGSIVIFGDHTRTVKYVDFDFCVGADGVKVLQPNNSLSAKYLYYFIKWSNIPSNGYARHFKFLKEVKIKYPTDISIQQAIATELDALQEMIDGYKAQIADLDVLAQSIFLDMFGDPVTNPKGWEIMKIGEISEVTSSKRIYQSEQTKSGIPFYKISDFPNLIEYGYSDTGIFISQAKYEELKSKKLVPNESDLLITSRGTLGLCYIVKDEDCFYFQDGMITWLKNLKSTVLSAFLGFMFQSSLFKNQIEKAQNGSTIAYLSIAMIRKFDMIVPPIKLQQHFVSQVEAIEKQKELIRDQLAETETLMAERMQYYFS